MRRLRGHERVSGLEQFTGYLFVLPTFLILGVFVLFAAVYSLWISLMHYDPFFHTVYPVGLSNYKYVASSRLYWFSMLHALEYTGVVVTIQTFLAFFFAVLFNEKTPVSRFTRAIVFIPAVTSSAVISVLFIWVFSAQGLLNAFLVHLGVHPENWLESTTWAFPAIMGLNIFTTAPYFMIMYLAGLQSIPSSILESAALDGVRNAFQRFRYFYFPMLKFTVFFVVVLGIIGSMQLFDQVFIMTDGGPGNSTYVPLIYIYNQAFVFDNFGAAAAASFILFVIILILTLAQRRLISEVRWA